MALDPADWKISAHPASGLYYAERRRDGEPFGHPTRGVAFFLDREAVLEALFDTADEAQKDEEG